MNHEEYTLIWSDGETTTIDPVVAKIVLCTLVYDKFSEGKLAKEIQRACKSIGEPLTLKQLKQCKAEEYLLEFVRQLDESEILQCACMHD